MTWSPALPQVSIDSRQLAFWLPVLTRGSTGLRAVPVTHGSTGLRAVPVTHGSTGLRAVPVTHGSTGLRAVPVTHGSTGLRVVPVTCGSTGLMVAQTGSLSCYCTSISSSVPLVLRSATYVTPHPLTLN